MSKKTLRSGAAAGAVVLSAGTGLATNLLTDQPSWGAGAAVVVLVVAGVALAVAISMLEHRDSRAPHPAPASPAFGQSGLSQHVDVARGRTTMAGRDVHHGMPAGYVVLCLLIVAGMAVAVLLVAVKLAPPSTANAGPVSSSPSSTPEDLGYQLSASPGDPLSVKVSAKASGQPVPGLTYWFIVEVNYGTGYIEYYPRWKMTGRSTSFDVPLPGKANTEYRRNGRVYGLNSSQNGQVEDKLGHSASGVDDFFDKPIGQPVSNAVKLPY